MNIEFCILFFVCGLVVGFVGSVVGGAVIATPTKIAQHMSVSFVIANCFPGFFYGHFYQENTLVGVVYGFCGTLGGVLGWLIYSILILRR
jgi:fatty-acid desaturase